MASRWTWFLLLVAWLAIGRPAYAQSINSLRLEGVVRDRLTGTPLGGAQVWAGEARGEDQGTGIGIARTTTDSLGRYRLDLGVHPADLVVRLAGSASAFDGVSR